MANFSFPEFNRRYVLIPMLVLISLVLVSYVVTEERRSYTTALAVGVRDRQERLRELAEFIYAVSDAESAQRGFLLTLDQNYLEPFAGARARAHSALNDLLARYAKRDADELPHLLAAKNHIDSKFSEMQTTIDLAKAAGKNNAALHMMKTDTGLRWMNDLRNEVEQIRTRERTRVYADIDFWEAQVRTNRYVSTVAAILNIALLLAIGVLITWEIERRSAVAKKLNIMVEERTAELTELSEHMLRIRENEKLRLARELHDELGGLLVAMKMDLSQLAKKFDFTQPPDVVVRWQRIQSALTSGVALKRRVIEELRPTLLDNLGLIAAMRWQCEETCSQANLALTADFPAEEMNVDANVAIAIFRVAQETMINIVKHAGATAVNVTLKFTDKELLLTIEDDGIGLPGGLKKISGSHGLLSMKYRMQVIGGTFQIEPVVPHGTRVVVSLALELINNAIAKPE